MESSRSERPLSRETRMRHRNEKVRANDKNAFSDTEKESVGRKQGIGSAENIEQVLFMFWLAGQGRYQISAVQWASER